MRRERALARRAGWLEVAPVRLAVQFSTTIGTIHWDEIHAACQGDDGTYVLGGTIGHNTHAAWLIGLDAAGNETWSRSLAGQSISGSSGNTAYDTINSIVAVEGGYVVSGFTGLGNATRDASGESSS